MNIMIVFAAIVAAIVFLALCAKNLESWRRRGVAQYRWWVTATDIFLSFIPNRSITESLEKIYNDFSGERYCGGFAFFLQCLFIRDIELIKQVAVKDFDHFMDHNQMLPTDSEPMWEKNLFSLKGDKWKVMRATLSPSFTSSKMKIIFKLISEYMVTAVQYFEEQPQPITLEMKTTLNRITNDVIATSAFGINCDSLRNPNNEFYLFGKELINFRGFKQYLNMFCLMMTPRLAKLLGIRLFSQKATKFFSDIVTTNIESRKKHGIVRPDMIHLLMEAQKERLGVDDADSNDDKRAKPQLTDDDIMAQALIFFFAGFETVSVIMSFVAHELAVNPDIQERLQNEIDETLENCADGLTYEALFKMKYLDMVVSETLRKWPAAVASDRVCVKPYTIEPVRDGEQPLHINKGDVLCIPTFAIHRDEKFYPDPERFDPERFNDENKANINPYAYIPFGVGPRICIGNRFALMEIKTLFFYLLSKFTLTVVDKTNVPFKVGKNSFQLTAHGGFWLGLKRRNL